MTAPIIIVNPAIDILFLVCVSNAILYAGIYAHLKNRLLENVAKWDVIFSLSTFGIIALNYFNSGVKISLFGFSFGWFWFTIIIHFILDTILSFFYLPKMEKR